MRLIKFLLYLAILVGSLYFLLELHNMNLVDGQPVRIMVPFVSEECPSDSYQIQRESCIEGYNFQVVLIAATVLGVFVGFLLVSFQLLSEKHHSNRLRSEIKKLKAELDSLRNQGISEEMMIVDSSKSLDI